MCQGARKNLTQKDQHSFGRNCPGSSNQQNGELPKYQKANNFTKNGPFFFGQIHLCFCLHPFSLSDAGMSYARAVISNFPSRWLIANTQ